MQVDNRWLGTSLGRCRLHVDETPKEKNLHEEEAVDGRELEGTRNKLKCQDVVAEGGVRHHPNTGVQAGHRDYLGSVFQQGYGERAEPVREREQEKRRFRTARGAHVWHTVAIELTPA